MVNHGFETSTVSSVEAQAHRFGGLFEFAVFSRDEKSIRRSPSQVSYGGFCFLENRGNKNCPGSDR